MAVKSLKETYPQKYCLKFICRFLYYIGCGDCWYETKTRSRLEKMIYPLWAILSNSYVIIGIVNQLAAHFIDLTSKERNDLLQHSIAHPTIYMKVSVLYLQRNRIKIMFKKFLEDTRSTFSSSVLDKAAMKKGVSYSIALCTVTYGTLFFTLLDGVRVHYTEGLPIRAEVTYYPRPSDSGTSVNVVRFFNEFHWWYLVAHMLLVDCLSICSLIFLEAKFKLLQLYFRNLKNIFTKNTELKTQKKLDEEFNKGFVVGIKLHEDALWCATNVQFALGNIYSVQIIQSLTLFGICLIKLVISERTVMVVFATAFYIACMVVLTGAYMLVAGDISYEAAMLSTAIMQSGWEYSHSYCELRPLILTAIQRSQVPVQMTAFGIVELSYANFISVLRTSYSFCAVML